MKAAGEQIIEHEQLGEIIEKSLKTAQLEIKQRLLKSNNNSTNEKLNIIAD